MILIKERVTNPALIIVMTRHGVSFDSLYGNIIQLDVDHIEGDIVEVIGRKYILSSTLNPEILHSSDGKMPIRKTPRVYKAGTYVQLAQLDLIERMESEIIFDIPGFRRYEETTRFYSIKDVKVINDDIEFFSDESRYRDVGRCYYIRDCSL